MATYNRIYIARSRTKKIFANMRRQGKDFSGRETPLFPNMMVQAQKEMGEGSAIPTNPQHTPTITQPSLFQPQKIHKPRKPKKKDTQIPQSSVPSDNLADEAVNEENVYKYSNDPLLSGEDRLKLEELMALCTNLQNRVGLSVRVVSSEDEGLGEEDASKQERKIRNIDADEDITLENIHDEDMFGVNDLDGDEVVVESEVADIYVNLSIDEVTLAQALAAWKSAKVQEKGYVIKELSVPVSAASTKVSTVIPTTAATTIIAVSSRPKAKWIVFHEQEQAPTPINDQLRLDEELAFRLQAEKEEEERLAREKAQQIKEANTAWDDIHAKVEHKLDEKVEAEVDDAKEAEELKQCLEIVPDDGDDVTVDATPLSVKMLIMLKNFDREDLEVLWSIVKTRFNKTEPVNYMDTFLHLNLKTMFEHHLEDNVWKNQQGLVKVLNWKLYDSYGVHCVTMQNILYYLLVEKMYPLTKHTLRQMFNDVKLQVDYECEMTFELLRLVKKQLKEGCVPQ
ncbi:hypothetical protein Tco_1211003 [Tanacetum coccineum]